MKIGKHNLHLHSISVHFTNALYPAAVFFLMISHFYRREFSLFTYFHLMLLANFAAPVSYVTGLIEWKEKYKAARVRIFIRKSQYGAILLVLGTACTLWYGFSPEILDDAGLLRLLFFLLNLSILPVVICLGYLGGKLVFGAAH